MDAYLTNNLEQSDELAYDVADLFKLFADSTRIRILVLLFDRELCVGDIAANLEMSQTAISHQTAYSKAKPPDQVPPGGQEYDLRPGGRPCKDYYKLRH